MLSQKWLDAVLCKAHGMLKKNCIIVNAHSVKIWTELQVKRNCRHRDKKYVKRGAGIRTSDCALPMATAT